MLSFLSDFFQKKKIDLFAPIPLDACRIEKPYLLERVGIKSGTAILLAIPYFTKACAAPSRNLSAYAVSRDYHLYYAELFGELLPLLRERFPQNRFAGFADHSPICEGEACVKAGLGVMGKNGLLLTQKYSSYVFLGEIVTDARLPCTLYPFTVCEDCGACQRACPLSKGESVCLSALTQKKGTLSQEEEAYVLQYGSVWGCDLCQDACPYTKRAIREESIYSPIPFFGEQAIPCLSSRLLDAMQEDDFRRRAFSWRGYDTIKRNLTLFERNFETKGESEC